MNALCVENVSLVYQPGSGQTVAVNEVSLLLEERQFLGVIGPSGSGKSSLLYLMSGLKRPSAGLVSFRGHSYNELSDDALAVLRRRHFGFVFQQHFLINYLTALENVLVGAESVNGITRQQAKALLERLHLGDKLERFPYQLSLGERQRVAVARAMINQPAIIFADEPTASLDHVTGRLVVETLAEYCALGSLVVVTHDPEMLVGAQHIVRLRDGVMVEDLEQTPSEVGRTSL